MNPRLVFEKKSIFMSDLGEKSSIPSISEIHNLQNRKISHLGEDDGLFIGYGALKTVYPYRQRNSYTRELEEREIPVAILENKYLKATFLTSLGGRLWSLIDKTTGKNLLYTNDVIRPSNLSVRNAWFSGGVEWNIGVIGHTPFTTEQVFVSELETPEGDPVLRIYEYERIRGVTWQIDFWLTQESRYLMCRVRIQNDNDSLCPMYWWSNIAVPEHKGGRFIVPANEAYTHSELDGSVIKVDTPIVKGTDISYYGDIPTAVDYFFDVTDIKEKYIASFDREGYGLFQASTSKMRGRKLFSWGHSNGAKKWQGFLTESAGDYIEIQAGVERTQYGCLPMPPKTVWEWIEVYGAVQVEPESLFSSYENASTEVTSQVDKIVDYSKLEIILKETKESIAKKPSSKVICRGTGYGALENLRRKAQNIKQMSPQLDFCNIDDDNRQWVNLLENGCFMEQDIHKVPDSYMSQDEWFDLLSKSVGGKNENNWYAWYQLGLMNINRENYLNAKICIEKSLKIEETSWAYHALAVISDITGESVDIEDYILKSISMNPNDLSMAKEGLHILLKSKLYTEILDISKLLSSNILNDGRIQMLICAANLYTGNVDEADLIMNSGDGLLVPDIREGEELLGELWIEIEKKKNPSAREEDLHIPIKFDFRMHAGI